MNPLKFLTEDERDHLESFLKARIDTDTRNAMIILTALHSGARPNELLGITWDDVNTETGEIFLRTLKGGRPRAVVVPSFVRDGLRRLKAMSPERPFDISYSRLTEVWHMYRPSRLKPFKCLRHSFAMRAYDRTKDVRFVQRALGHRSITNTMIYLEYEYTAKEYKKLMRVK